MNKTLDFDYNQLDTQMLVLAGASNEQIDSFTKLFPGGKVNLTEELCVKLANDFDWDWMAETFLIGKQFDYIRQLSTINEECAAVNRAKAFYNTAFKG